MDQLPVRLEDMVACVDREIGMRLAVYPRWVAQKKLTQATADKEIARMRAVRAALLRAEALQLFVEDLVSQSVGPSTIPGGVEARLVEVSARFPVRV